MSFKFPFTNYHELNLDWILKKVETLSVNAEADANTIATYEERLQTAETQAQNAETSAANAQSAATSAAAVAENALTTANSAQSSADASGALASQAATKADAAQIAAESARQAAETAQATAANFDGRITSAERQASEALNMAQSFDEQARAAITTANNAANVATEAQASANATALELARQRTALVTIGSQQTAAINSAGAAQVTAIYNAGQAVLDSIPADYMNGVELVKDYTLGLYPQIETDYASILSFDNGADDIPVKELNVNIIPKQSGTGEPSLTNIRSISGWTGLEVLDTGINLYNAEAINRREANGITITVNNGTITFNGTASANAYFSIYNSGLPNGNYAFSFNNPIENSGVHISFRNTRNEYFIDAVLDTVNKTVILRDKEPTDILLYVSSGVTLSNFVIRPQLQTGLTVTDYEYYTSSQISVTFPTESGTVYGGILTVNPDRTGTLTVTHGIATENNFTEAGTGLSAGGLHWVDYNITNITTAGNSICSVFGQRKDSNEGWSSSSPCYAFTNRLRIRVYCAESTIAEFKEMYTGLQIIYPLIITPTYQLTETEISGILHTVYGNNNVWANVGNTALTYRADLSKYITENSIANYAKFASMIAGVETGLTASKTYSAGDYFIVGQKLYKALTNIATGAAFTIGTNCEETTVGAELILAQ